MKAALDAYRAGYDPGAGRAVQDAGIRASDAYVAAHDPLKQRVGRADLVLGVDPGTYFCGGLALALAGRAHAGFIHVPPEARLPRAELLALTGEVLALAAAALGARRVLVTGFGPFPGVADNPSAAAALQAGGVVLRLQDENGMFAGMAPVLAQLEAAIAAFGPFDALIALGVDSRQALARPRFTVETQSRGMREPGYEPRGFTPLDDLAIGLLNHFV